MVSWGGAYQDGQKKVYFDGPSRRSTGMNLIDEFWGRRRWSSCAPRSSAATPTGMWSRSRSEELVSRLRRRPLREARLFQDRRRRGLPEGAQSTTAAVGSIVYDFILPTTATRLRTGPTRLGRPLRPQEIPGKRALGNRSETNLEIALMADGVAPTRRLHAAQRPTTASIAPSRSSTPSRRTSIFWKAGAQPAAAPGLGRSGHGLA